MLNYLKTHKLTALLLLIVAYFLWQNYLPRPYYNLGAPSVSRQYAVDDMAESAGAPAAFKSSGLSILPPVEPDYAPEPGVSDRLVIQESDLSLLVKDVRQTVNQILDYAVQNGGYMVSSSLNQPEEAPFATVVVRVPADQLDQILEQYRSLAIKVSSENLSGRDVTDEYLDINTRLERLRKTQAKFEQLLDQATNFDQILRANQEIINLQNQIDQLIGRQQYLEQTSQLARLTIYLSTDELALPYTPSETFRPAVIFKLAVRSLVKTFRGLATNFIWIAVYSAIWLPALILFWLARRWWTRKSSNSH